jgi:hypothetical protein
MKEEIQEGANLPNQNNHQLFCLTLLKFPNLHVFDNMFLGQLEQAQLMNLLSILPVSTF